MKRFVLKMVLLQDNTYNKVYRADEKYKYITFMKIGTTDEKIVKKREKLHKNNFIFSYHCY